MPPLLLRMGSGKPEVREAAHAILVQATGLELPYDPTSDPRRRAADLSAWEEWYMTNSRALAHDPKSGRLVVLGTR